MPDTQNITLSGTWKKVSSEGVGVTFEASGGGYCQYVLYSEGTPAEDLLGFRLPPHHQHTLKMTQGQSLYARGNGAILVVNEF